MYIFDKHDRKFYCSEDMICLSLTSMIVNLVVILVVVMNGIHFVDDLSWFHMKDMEYEGIEPRNKNIHRNCKIKSSIGGLVELFRGTFYKMNFWCRGQYRGWILTIEINTS